MKRLLLIVLPLLFLGLAWGQEDYNINHIVEENGAYIKNIGWI